MTCYNKISIVVLFALAVQFVSCGYEDATPDYQVESLENELGLLESEVEIDIDELDVEGYYTESDTRTGCFEFNFPLDLVFPDGSEVEVGSRFEAREAIINFWKENGKMQGKVTLSYPLDVTLGNGDILTLNDREDLVNLFKECVRRRLHEIKKKCFQLSYPVNVVFPDQKVITVENQKQMGVLIYLWKKTNRGQKVRPRLQVPFDVVYPDGKTLTITSRDDLIKAIKDCLQ